MTTETKHTETPWHLHVDGEKVYASIRSSDGRCVADCGSRSDSIAQANARFIVTACNNHEALVEALKQISDGFFGDLQSAREFARAALANLETGRGEK